ncbi:MAG TPA: [protein-PII] uridylyltransferase [Actinomycetota bacterium]|nr:[protein-PII] uridylyltransferase [Actinomycetota bacterium]
MLAERDVLLSDEVLTGAAWCRAYAALVDQWLAGLFTQALGPAASDVALVAVGGYGRSELAPGSDIDVHLVHAGRRDIAQIAEAMWYPIWEAGLHLGHHVATAKETLRLADHDLETATTLLSARHVAGDASVSAELAAAAQATWERRGRSRLAELATGVAERHRRFGEVAFRLEPDLKEGRGGLRDVHALHWAEAAHRVLLDVDAPSLDAWYGVLLDARVELQRLTGHPTNVLALQEQEGVARALGDASALALMGRVAEAARSIAWTSDDAWRRIEASLRGRRGGEKPRALGPGIALAGGEVLVLDGAPVADPVFVLRVAAGAATEAATIERHSLEILAAQAPDLPDPWPEEARGLFCTLLLAGAEAIRVIEALDQRGLWGRLLPEWAGVRALPPHSAYHRFTVDRHLLEAVAHAARRAGQVDRPDLLAMVALLHDLGKGLPGDHTETGAVLARAVAARMGFGAADVETIGRAVELHLLLPQAATRRDLDDPTTIEQVADAVGDRSLLHLLAVLCEADSLATGPQAWGPWKAGLVGCLVERAEAVLTGLPATGDECRAAGEVFPSAAQLARLADGQEHIEGHGPVLTVMADDRPGLFSRVAGVLAMHGLDVLAAAAYSSDEGRALAEFRVADPLHDEPPWNRVIADLRRALGGGLAIQARVVARARTYAGTRQLSRAPAAAAVRIDNDASQVATVIDVHAPDAIGTLYRITRTLADFDLDIRKARVQTQGSEVVDSFYVRDRSGRKVTDPARLAEIERGVLHALTDERG